MAYAGAGLAILAVFTVVMLVLGLFGFAWLSRGLNDALSMCTNVSYPPGYCDMLRSVYTFIYGLILVVYLFLLLAGVLVMALAFASG